MKTCEICGIEYEERNCPNCLIAKTIWMALVGSIKSLAAVWTHLPQAFRESGQIEIAVYEAHAALITVGRMEDVEAAIKGNILPWQRLAQTLAAEQKETTKEGEK